MLQTAISYVDSNRALVTIMFAATASGAGDVNGHVSDSLTNAAG